MSVELEKTKELAREIDKALSDTQLQKIDKEMIPSLFFSTAIEHHRSILLLVENRLYGSSSSLLRCLFESYVKGLWFSKCADEAAFEKLRKDKFEKPFGVLVKEIEGVDPKGLQKAKKNHWSVLNSLTHSGLHQLSRRVTEENITSNYDQPFIEDMVKMASTYGFLSCAEVAIISKNEKTLESVYNISQKYGL